LPREPLINSSIDFRTDSRHDLRQACDTTCDKLATSLRQACDKLATCVTESGRMARPSVAIGPISTSLRFAAQICAQASRRNLYRALSELLTLEPAPVSTRELPASSFSAQSSHPIHARSFVSQGLNPYRLASWYASHGSTPSTSTRYLAMMAPVRSAPCAQCR